ncbi:hypothetical protein G5B47_02630 [Paenibacillus sp. 7124]|uniref:CCR4-Not complex component Not N-terminal domain-containing protein n=1 Tax=Paenibacillus apii TaxID=1850370 RepID=A0A6M1PFF9_9BACL|nr:hypothetical protein [Paenibacillus apii]NGM81304.1 hypothetical protein [Paenibacillus apii]
MRKIAVIFIALTMFLSSSTFLIQDQVLAKTSTKNSVKTEKQKMESIRYLQKQIDQLKKQLERLEIESESISRGSQKYRDNLRKQNSILKQMRYYNQQIIELAS